MKKTIYRTSRIAVFAAMLLGMVSCLEKYPGSAIPERDAMKTFSDAEQHLVGIYASLKSSALYSGLLTLLPDIQSDLVNAVDGNSNTYGKFYQWRILPTDEEVKAVYGSLYAVIGNCNFYLEHVDDVRATITSDEKLDWLDDYTGQVHTIRALCYSELIKCYCKAYDPVTAENELGVVLRKSYSLPEPVKRASLHDSYAFVLEDLEKAESLLDEDEDAADNEFITLSAAYALHARVALYMQNWDDAIRYSSILLDEKTDVYSLSSAFLQGGAYNGSAYSQFGGLWYFDSGSEIIWKIGFRAPKSIGGALGTVFLNFTRDYAYYYPDYVPSRWAMDLYSEKDMRKFEYFADADSGIQIGYSHGLSWPLLVKYHGNIEFSNNYRIYHVSMPKPFRLAEQYLIRAEAYCRSETMQNFGKASSDLNALKKARMQGGEVSLNAKNWLDEISDERVREFYMEGFRLNDLKRWGKGFKRTDPNVTGIQKEGSSLEIKSGNPLFVWPIPQHELEAPGADIAPNESNR